MKKSIQSAVLGYVAKESRGARLTVGKHIVKLVEWLVLHSRIQWDGDEKSHLPEFVDPTPQLGIMFRDENGDVGWHRFNVFGYKRWDDLTDEQQSSDQYEKVVFGQQVYACKQTKDGLVRIKDNKKTEGAQSFIDQFMATVGHTGSSVNDAMEDLMATGIEFQVELVNEDYEGEDTLKVKGFSKVTELASDFG